jgi:lipid A 3-O-deacylase
MPTKSARILSQAAFGVGFILLMLPLLCGRAHTMESKRTMPAQKGFSISLGNIYDPGLEDGQFFMATGLLLLNHKKIPPFPVSDAFRFKLEVSFGKGCDPSPGLMVSGNFLTLFYIDALATKALRPFVEGGVGLIAVEEKWTGQGSRLNFNPLLGIGLEFATRCDQRRYFLSGRLFHVSNGGLNKNNRGLNAIVFSTGVYF